MKLMIAQTNPLLAEPTNNLTALESLCRLAAEAKVDLLALPELAFTGYNIFERLDDLAEAIDGPIVTEVARRCPLSSINMATLLSSPLGRRSARPNNTCKLY